MNPKIALTLMTVMIALAPQAQSADSASMCNSAGQGGNVTGPKAVLMINYMKQNNLPGFYEFTAKKQPRIEPMNCEGPDTYTDLLESWQCDEATLTCKVRCYTETVQGPSHCWP